MGALDPVSTHLDQVLRIYCRDMNARSIRDLREAVARGRYPWLRRELQTALEQGAFTPTAWLEVTAGQPQPQETARRAMRREQRHLWGLLFPVYPYPVRQPTAGTRRTSRATRPA